MGLPSGRIYVATLLLFLLGLIGARLLFVLIHWPIYRRDPGRIWRRSEGGLALYGAVPLTLVGSIPLLAALGLPFGTFWDVATVPMLVGALVTKVGCLLNGCCGGRPTRSPIGMRLRDQRGVIERRIPAQLLEMGWLLLLLAGLACLAARRPIPGTLYVGVIGGYGLGRLFLETTREEQDRMARWPLHQLIAAATVAGCAIALWSVWPCF
jgi:prolipoprotein diacylglyceryltransferase